MVVAPTRGLNPRWIDIAKSARSQEPTMVGRFCRQFLLFAVRAMCGSVSILLGRMGEKEDESRSVITFESASIDKSLLHAYKNICRARWLPTLADLNTSKTIHYYRFRGLCLNDFSMFEFHFFPPLHEWAPHLWSRSTSKWKQKEKQNRNKFGLISFEMKLFIPLCCCLFHVTVHLAHSLWRPLIVASLFFLFERTPHLVSCFHYILFLFSSNFSLAHAPRSRWYLFPI